MASAQPQSTEPHDGPRPDPAAADPADTEEIGRHVAWLVAKAKGRGQETYRYLLLLRFAVVNILGFALLGAAYLQGYVDLVLAADGTGLSILIFVVFLGGLGVSGRKVAQTSRELNQIKAFDPLVASRATLYLAHIRGGDSESRVVAASALKLRLGQRIGVVRHTANSLILLGLIGTVVGFIIALAGVDPEHVGSVDSVGPMVAQLIEGMSVALFTTLVGAVLNLWLMVNHHMLATGTVNLVTALMEFGERHAGS